MSKKSPNSMSSFFDSESYTQPLNSVDDILEMNITVMDVEFRKGQYGEYALFNVIIDETGAELKVQSGAMVINALLRKAELERRFPFRCKITKFNRMYKPVDAD